MGSDKGYLGSTCYKALSDLPLYFLWGAFSLKMAWNVLTPLELLRRELAASDGVKRGISLTIVPDVFLFGLLLSLSIAGSGTGWHNSPRKVALLGGLTLIGSYALMIICSWIASQLLGRLKNADPKEEHPRSKD